MGTSSRFICRHIVRSKGRAVLLAMVSLFFILALGFLQQAIQNSEAEIEQLYELSTIRVELTAAPSAIAHHRHVGNVIRPETIHRIVDLGVTQREYIEAGHEYAVVIPSADGMLPADWEERTSVDFEMSLWFFHSHFDPILAVNDLDLFTIEHSRDALDELIAAERLLADGRAMGDMEISFAPGYDADSFVFSADRPIPVILPDTIMEWHNMALGDTVFLTTTFEDAHEWSAMEASVIGAHNRNIVRSGFLAAPLIPLDALAYMFGADTGHIMFRFEIAPAYSREIDVIRADFYYIMEQPDAGWAELSLSIRDQELRMVAAPMEQSLSLLRMLYPVAIGVSIVIGLGLSMLLMLQNAKNAAIMRVLGSPKLKSRLILMAELLLLCLLGLLIGLGALIFTGWGFGIASALGLMGLYFTGVSIGSIVGAVLVTNRPPLELLQVKE